MSGQQRQGWFRIPEAREITNDRKHKDDLLTPEGYANIVITSSPIWRSHE